jgi:REP element-mobilizing transposase RayT
MAFRYASAQCVLTPGGAGVPPALAERTLARTPWDARATRAGDASQKSAQSSWRFRGYLPHYDDGALPQFVTSRLVGTVACEQLDGLDKELSRLPDIEASPERRRRIEALLDSRAGVCWLAKPRVATIVREALRYFDGDRYDLHACVIMLNHVHVLFTPKARVGIGQIIGAWKSYTAKAANRVLGRSGEFWQADYFDRAIRSERHFSNVVAYIEGNPTRAGLCDCNHAWPWSSAAHESAQDARAPRTADVPPRQGGI